MTDVDNDTLEAVKIVWQRSPAIAEIMPLPPQQAPLKPGQPLLNTEFTSKEEKRDQAATGGVWFDFRRVEIKIRGLKPDVVNASQTVRGVFVHGLKLPYPSGVCAMGIVPDKDTDYERDETKGGDDIWRATISFFAESVRVG